MDKAESEAAIKKLDLKLRQLRLQQKISEKDADENGPEETDRRLRRMDRYVVFEAILGLMLLFATVLLFREEWISFDDYYLSFELAAFIPRFGHAPRAMEKWKDNSIQEVDAILSSDIRVDARTIGKRVLGAVGCSSPWVRRKSRSTDRG